MGVLLLFEALVLSSKLFFVKFMSRSITKNKNFSMVKDTDLKLGCWLNKVLWCQIYEQSGPGERSLGHLAL